MDSVIIKKITGINELKELIEVYSQAFESEYTTDDVYLEALLENQTAVLIGAFVEEKVVGGIVAFEMTPIHGNREIYIYDIAVLPLYQKKGIGLKLMDQIKMEAKMRRVKTIFVEAESEDQGAVAFYRALGGEEVKVNHFNFSA